MSAPTSRGEALRKEGVFVPASKGASPQNPRKSGDKTHRGKHNVTLTHNEKEKEKIMENPNAVVTAPVVTGTPAPVAAAPVAAAPVAAAPVAAPNPIYTMRRAGGLAIDTFVVVATTSAILGAGFGVYKFATKKAQ